MVFGKRLTTSGVDPLKPSFPGPGCYNDGRSRDINVDGKYSSSNHRNSGA